LTPAAGFSRFWTPTFSTHPKSKKSQKLQAFNSKSLEEAHDRLVQAASSQVEDMKKRRSALEGRRLEALESMHDKIREVMHAEIDYVKELAGDFDFVSIGRWCVAPDSQETDVPSTSESSNPAFEAPSGMTSSSTRENQDEVFVKDLS
jgi:hypothetical protein